MLGLKELPPNFIAGKLLLSNRASDAQLVICRKSFLVFQPSLYVHPPAPLPHLCPALTDVVEIACLLFKEAELLENVIIYFLSWPHSLQIIFQYLL